jgi:hypothetical protein
MTFVSSAKGDNVTKLDTVVIKYGRGGMTYDRTPIKKGVELTKEI